MATEVVFPRPEIIGTVPAEAFTQLTAQLEATGSTRAIMQFTGAQLDRSVSAKHEAVLAPALAPFIGPVALRETEYHRNPNPILIASVSHGFVVPGQPQIVPAAAWHADHRTYNCADALPSEFAVGTLWLTDQKSKPDIIEALSRNSRLPFGLTSFSPKLFEIVEFDKRHPHRSPSNPHHYPVLRTHIKIMVHKQY